MSCINIQKQISAISLLSKEREELAQSLQGGGLSLKEGSKRLEEIKEKLKTQKDFFIFNERELYKLGAALREKHNLQAVGKFHEGYAIAQDWDGNYFHVDLQGEQLYKNRFRKIKDFSEGRAVVGNEARLMIIDTTNKRIGKTYREVGIFSSGLAPVREKTGQWYYITRDGERIENNEYEQAGNFIDGVARVRKDDGLCYFIKQDGSLLNEIGYKEAQPFRDGLAAVGERGNLYHIDTFGKRLNAEEYVMVGLFSNGLANVTQNGKRFYITKEGKKLNDKDYDFAGEFNNGCATVKSGDDWHFIARNGLRINTENYKQVMDFSCGLAAGMPKGSNKWHFITTDGSRLNEEEYTSVETFSLGVANVTQGRRKFKVDINGKEIIKR